MKIAGVNLNKEFLIAAIIGAIIGTITVRVVNRFFDPVLDKTAGPD